MKNKYHYAVQYRCVGQEGDVFHRESRRQAERENYFNGPEEVYAVMVGTGRKRSVVADCYSKADAKMLRDALNKAAA